MRYLGAGLLFVFALPIAAQGPSPLAQVPATCPVVIQVRGLDRNKDRLLAMMGNIVKGPQGRRMINDVEDKYDDLINGRLLPGRFVKGVKKDGSIFIALAALPENVNEIGESIVLIVPVTKYADFRDGLLTADERGDLDKRDGYEVATIMGKQVFFVERPGYAVVALRRDLANQFKKAQPGLDKKVDADSAKHLLSSDVCVYIDTVALGKKYSEQLLEFRQTIVQKMLDEQGPLGRSPEMRETLKVLVKEFTKVLKDSRVVLVSTLLEPEGLKIHAHMAFGRDTNTAAFLKNQKLTALDDIGQLPANQRTFSANTVAATEGSPPAFIEAIRKIMAERKGLLESEKLEEEAGRTLDLNASQDRLSLEGIEIKMCKKPEKMVQSLTKLYENLKEGEFGDHNLILAEKPEVRLNAQEHRGFKLHKVRLVFDLEKSAQGQNVTVAFLRRQIGGDEGQLWFGSDGNVFVLLKSKTWAGAQTHLNSFLDRGNNVIGKNAGFIKARKQLPAMVSFLMMEETSVYTQIMLDFEAQQAKRFVPAAPRPRPGQEVYWGVAATFAGEHVSIDAWVPTRIFHDYFKVLGVSQ